MRILTLLAGPDCVPSVLRLAAEIRAFNAEIDFRLRFLDIEIAESYAAARETLEALGEEADHAQRLALEANRPLEASAALALALARERPDLLVVAGSGGLGEAGLAAARAAGTKLAFYGPGRGSAEGALDLGEEARGAVAAMSGVAREIR
jgi:hypothetical protein